MSSPLTVVISTTQKATIGLKPIDQFGKPFVIPTGTVPVWTVSTGTVAPVVAADGLSAVIPSTDGASDNVIDVTVPGSPVTGQILFHCDVTPPPTPVLTDLGLFTVSVDPK